MSPFSRRGGRKDCFTDHRALEKSKETRGEKKEGGDLKRLFFFLPHTLSLSPSLPLTLSLTLTHTHTHSLSPSSPLSIPLLMAIKGAENKKKKKKTTTTTNFKPAQSMSH